MLPFSSAFEQGTKIWLNINSSDLQAAIDDPQAMQLIQLPGEKKGSSVRLYLRAVEGARRPRYILVITNQPEGARETIMDALYCPAHLAPDSPTPMEVLAGLCRSYGLRIRLGGLTDKLIYSRTLLAQGGDQSFRPELVDKPSGNAKLNAFVKRNEDGSLDVVLVFAIDVSALKKKLASQA
jgi:hypothetical protein